MMTVTTVTGCPTVAVVREVGNAGVEGAGCVGNIGGGGVGYGILIVVGWMAMKAHC